MRCSQLDTPEARARSLSGVSGIRELCREQLCGVGCDSAGRDSEE